MKETELKQMNTKELETLFIAVKKELESRKVDNKVMLTLRDEFNKVAKYEISRYNGGWVKRVVGIDKTRTNGYSLIGGFINGTTKKNYWEKGSIFVDCDTQGSRKHQERIYQLFYLNKQGKMELLAYDTTPDYAVNFWDKIENKLFEEA